MRYSCYASNGKLDIGDIVIILSYSNPQYYLYKITGYGEYNGMPKVYFKRVHPETLEVFPDVVGSWLDFPEAVNEFRIVYKVRIFGGYKRL